MIEIFRRGCHVAMGGQVMCFTDRDLNALATGYRPSRRLAPLVLGHPENDAPAYGTVARLEYRDGSLYAVPGAVSDELTSLVRAGRFRKVSASFLGPWAPSNPTPGAYYLRHVGFLGAMPPAVKGMADPVFGESCPLRCDAVGAALDVAGLAALARFVVPDGSRVDSRGLALHRRALAFQEASGSDYATAVRRISAQAVGCVVPSGWRVTEG